MANPVKGEVAFSAGDASFTFKLGFNAMCSLEDELGLESASQFGEVLSSNMKLGTLRSIFHAGLKEHQPQITAADAGNLIDEMGTDEVGRVITEAFQRSFGKGEGAASNGAARPRKPKNDGTGDGSSATGLN